MLILGGLCWPAWCFIGSSVLSEVYISFSSWRLQAENLLASVPAPQPTADDGLCGTETPLTCSKDLLKTLVAVLAKPWLQGLGRDWLVVSVSLFKERSSRFSLWALCVCFRTKWSLQDSPVVSFSFPPVLFPPDRLWVFPILVLLLQFWLMFDKPDWLVLEAALE